MEKKQVTATEYLCNESFDCYRTKPLQITIFLILFVTVSSNLFAQTAISGINASYDNITDTSDDYTAGGINYNFNVGSTNNLILESIIVGSETFTADKFADRIEIVRVDNAVVTGNKQLMFYEFDSEDASNINLKPGFNNTMEEVLLSSIINRGTDNVFGNQGDGSGNNNNIERIDFIFDDGIIVSGTPSNEGFIILERGGNDAFNIAPITALDTNGNPAAFGNVVSIGTGGWGNSSISIVTSVLSSPTPADDLERTTNVGSQAISGVAITYADLGLNEHDLFFGFSLAGGDVTTDGANWTAVTNPAFFPTTTSSTSGAEGGLDLLAGGSIFTTNQVEASYTLTGGECWRMLSSPVPTTYRNLLNGLWTQGTDGANYDGGVPNVLIWPNSQSGSDPSGWQTPASLLDPIPAGTGILVSVYADDDFTGNDTWSDKTVEISGTGYSGDITPMLNENDDGWTLVGNPYNFPVQFSDLNLNADVNDVAYVYDRNAGGGTGGWLSTDGSVGDIFDGIIAPFQGFFIQNNGSNPEMTFTESAATTGGQFYGKENEQPENIVRLELNGEGLYNSAWITLSVNGASERIRGDAFELMPFSEEYALFGSRKGEQLFDIGHFPATNGIEIPVAVETTLPGHYTITATDLTLSDGMKLVFIDIEEDITIPVTENFRYDFTINNGFAKKEAVSGALSCQSTPEQIATAFTPQKSASTQPGRFIIQAIETGSTIGGTLPTEYSLQQNYPNPFNPTTVIRYELPHQADVRIEVFDMNGRRVAILAEGSVQAGVHTVNFDASHLSSGVYLYTLQTDGVALTRKLTLIK